MSESVAALLEFDTESGGRFPVPLKKKPFIRPEAQDHNPVEYDCAYVGLRRTINGEWNDVLELPISSKPWGRFFVTDERVAFVHSPSGRKFKNSAFVAQIRHVNCAGVAAHKFSMGFSDNFGGIALMAQDAGTEDYFRLELRLTGRGNGLALADDVLQRVVARHLSSFDDQHDDETRSKYAELGGHRFAADRGEWDVVGMPMFKTLDA